MMGDKKMKQGKEGNDGWGKETTRRKRKEGERRGNVKGRNKEGNGSKADKE